MRIEIHIRRPLLTLSLIAFSCAVGIGLAQANVRFPEGGVGGENLGATLASARETIDNEHIKQAILSRKSEILGYQLSSLEQQMKDLSSPEALKEWHEAKTVLLALHKEKKQSEAFLLQSLDALWTSEGYAATDVSDNAPQNCSLAQWPVVPSKGISAYFRDKRYEEKFGFQHNAIDIPIEQGSIVRAPLGGIVSAVVDNGLGYSSMTLRHDNGYETIYGHITAALVSEGDRVAAGDAIAKSGGMPGTKGAGGLTTGPHLHFAMKRTEKHEDGTKTTIFIDPLRCLTGIGDE